MRTYKNVPVRDIKLLLGFCMGIADKEIYLCEKTVLREQENKFKILLENRMRGVPAPYLIGETEFMGLKFVVDENVLIPRQETEILVENIIKTASVWRGPVSILDIGTGTGNIAVSLAKFLPGATVHAVDVSSNALEIARKNAFVNSVEDKITFVEMDIFSDSSAHKILKKQFDIIVSNPPYINSEDMKNLPVEVRHEPVIALHGGDNGMTFYERIIPLAKMLLSDAGYLFFEIGYHHSGRVKKIMRDCLFTDMHVIKDYSGEERVLYGKNIN